MGSKVKSWVNQMTSLRLSQVLEMYYSAQGVNFNTEYRACERYARYIGLTSKSDILESQVTQLQ